MEITVASCSLIDTGVIRQWFEELDERVSDEENDETDVGEWVIRNYDRVEGLWSRLIFAYETVYENACDQTVKHLEWKPEIKAALVAYQTPGGGTQLIAAERQRQMDKEGWTPEHDDQHRKSELLYAAEAYMFGDSDNWPWDEESYKPKNTIDDLIRAGALIAAEIDRLQRKTTC